jgi:lipoate-protein ligase A
MKFLDLTLDQAAANLACDEALLEMIDGDPSEENCLRVWEAQNHFVVLGHSNAWRREVDSAACRDNGVPILRRVSGGGTVLQGPGCLNYSLILRHSGQTLGSIRDTFAFVLDRHRRMIERLCCGTSRVDGVSDLTYNGLKFSGNAQYRKARAFLVHGTFLLSFDLGMVERCLRIPAKQPAYRAGRPHREFITNLPVDRGSLRAALRASWGARSPQQNVPWERIERLVRERYSTNAWSEKF